MNTFTEFEALPLGNEYEEAEEFERGRRRPPRPPARRVQAPRAWPAPPRNLAPPWPLRPSRPRPPAVWYGPPWTSWGASASMRDAGAPPSTAQAAFEPDPEPDRGAGADFGDDAPGDAPANDEEMTMHRLNCKCPRCGGAAPAFEFVAPQAYAQFEEGEANFESEDESADEGQFESEGESWSEAGPFSEAQELALAAELLSVSSEAEMDQFLGSVWRGVKKAGAAAAQFAAPYSGLLKAVAKKALPFAGGALGSFIPIPGVGTMVGKALGTALGNALEAEAGGAMESEDREFEMARRFVRIAGTTAKNWVPGAPGGNTPAALDAALQAAARQHLPNFRGEPQGSVPGMSGTWTRRGTELLLHGV